ncbi:exodeoxyribonuclease V subunit gamma, partial [Luteimonas sp. SDU101]|uniref:exodeoxyribonuclease V subunit gamma n=1 Tax=Luteimonas sp. SDU101 TaxID=3422593 RepID=UPI003EB93C41
MHIDARTDFRLYHSNALDVLAGLLANELRTSVPGQGLLEPDVVLIPQVALRRWLQATLAQAHGVAANLEFLTPGEFVQRALDANVPGRGEDLDAAALRWRIHAALADPAELRERALQPLRSYLQDAPDPLKAWSLAGELAQAFEKYKAWRREWLLGWEAGEAPLDPQAALWRRVAGGTRHRARRIHEYLQGFADPESPLPAGLPRRLFAFAILNVSPDVLRVIATQARVGTLHLYVPSPSRDYWGDLQRVRGGDPEAAAGENPLLRAWGAAGRDFMAVLGSYEVVHPDLEIRGDADPGERPGPEVGSTAARRDGDGGQVDAAAGSDAGLPFDPGLLRRLQSDLFHRRATPGFALRTAVDKTDPSLQLHACHTRLRELQVLHDQLRALFEDPRFDPPLQPREVAVLAPDIDPYLPYLDAVFGGRGRGDAIPYAVADASPLAGEPLAEVFLRLLALPVARFGLVETLDLLASPPLAEAAGLDAAAFVRLH